MSPRFALKAATDAIHRELDTALSRLDLGEPSDYRRFLQFHGRTVPAIEHALASGGLGDLVEGWGEARRSSAIESDLRLMGEGMPAAVSAPPIHGTAGLLGTAYVLEGSRLGARVLRRRVRKGLPTEFLDDRNGHGAWPKIVAALDQILHSDVLLCEAKEAAYRCFALFLNVAHENEI